MTANFENDFKNEISFESETATYRAVGGRAGAPPQFDSVPIEDCASQHAHKTAICQGARASHGAQRGVEVRLSNARSVFR